MAVLLTPVLALAGGLGFQAVGCLIGVMAIFTWAADRTGAEYLQALWPIFLVAFTGWAWLSALWSDYEATNASLLFGLLIPLLFVPMVFLRIPTSLKKPLIWAVIGAGLLGVILLLSDSASGFALSFWADPVPPGGDPELRRGNAEMNVGRGQVSYVQLLWPIAGLMILNIKQGWSLAALSFIGLAVSARLNNLEIIIPTLIIAVCAAAFAWRHPRLGVKFAFFFAIFSLVFAPWLGFLCDFAGDDFMGKIPLSWEHRVRMWSYSWELIQQAPWIGHGFDSARVFDGLTFQAPDGRDITVMSMHPHNIGLQIWLETGLIGIILAVSFLLTLMTVALKYCTGPVGAFAATGLIVTIATSGSVTIGVWQHWWWALIVLASSLIILIGDQ